MVIKRVSFIEVRSPDSYIFKKFPIPRLGAVLLSTMLKERGYEAKAFIEDIKKPDWHFVENSDLVCISAITSTIYTAYETASRLRRLGIPVVMGGAHPTFMAEESLNYSDYVVRGEGEYTFFELIDYLEKGTPQLASIRGLSYRDSHGEVVHNPLREFVQDLDSLIDPDFSLVHGWKSSTVNPIASSRGCAFNCRFCLVAPMFGRKSRFRSVERIITELKRIRSNSRAPIFFVDDNFAANRKRTKEILRGMIAERMKPRWAAMVRPDIAKDEELLALLADSGNFTASIGFESINPSALEAFEKKQTLQDNIRCIEALKAHGIRIHGMFVFGADTDTVDTLKETAEFSSKMGIDSVQFMILTPLPGTPVYEEFGQSGRLIHRDWSKYDIHHIVYRPLLMNPQTLHMETLRAMQKFYSSGYILKRLMKADLFYFAFGLYSRRIINRAVRESAEYIEYLDGLPECAPSFLEDPKNNR